MANPHAQAAGYTVLESVVFVESLPKNPSGKLVKRELRKFLKGCSSDRDYARRS